MQLCCEKHATCSRHMDGGGGRAMIIGIGFGRRIGYRGTGYGV